MGKETLCLALDESAYGNSNGYPEIYVGIFSRIPRDVSPTEQGIRKKINEKQLLSFFETGERDFLALYCYRKELENSWANRRKIRVPHIIQSAPIILSRWTKGYSENEGIELYFDGKEVCIDENEIEILDRKLKAIGLDRRGLHFSPKSRTDLEPYYPYMLCIAHHIARYADLHQRGEWNSQTREAKNLRELIERRKITL